MDTPKISVLTEEENISPQNESIKQSEGLQVPPKRERKLSVGSSIEASRPKKIGQSKSPQLRSRSKTRDSSQKKIKSKELIDGDTFIPPEKSNSVPFEKNEHIPSENESDSSKISENRKIDLRSSTGGDPPKKLQMSGEFSLKRSTTHGKSTPLVVKDGDSLDTIERFEFSSLNRSPSYRRGKIEIKKEPELVDWKTIPEGEKDLIKIQAISVPTLVFLLSQIPKDSPSNCTELQMRKTFLMTHLVWITPHELAKILIQIYNSTNIYQTHFGIASIIQQWCRMNQISDDQEAFYELRNFWSKLESDQDYLPYCILSLNILKVESSLNSGIQGLLKSASGAIIVRGPRKKEEESHEGETNKVISFGIEMSPSQEEKSSVRDSISKLPKFFGESKTIATRYKQVLKDNVHSPTLLPDVMLLFYELNNLAEQITQLEFGLMASIKAHEFLKQAWNKTQREKLAPNICKVTNWFNTISQWFCTLIVTSPTPMFRSVVIELLISLAVILENGNYVNDQETSIVPNYNGVMEVLSALNNSAVRRLKLSWEGVSEKAMSEFKRLSTLMSPQSNYKNYRELLKNRDPPYVPCVGMYLTDFTFMDDCKEDKIDGLLNIDKMTTIGNWIEEFSNFRKSGPSFNHSSLLEFLKELRPSSSQVWDDEELYRFSKLKESKSDIEAPPAQRKKIKEAVDNNTLKIDLSEIRKSTASDLDLYFATSDNVSYPPGSVIVEHRQVNLFFFKVSKGRVSAQMYENNKFVNIRAYLQGEWFCEHCICEPGSKSSLRYVADEQTEVRRIYAPLLSDVLFSDIQNSLHFFRTISLYLAHKLARLNEKAKSSRIVRNSTHLQMGSEPIIKDKRKVLDNPEILLSKLRLTNETLIKYYFAITQTKMVTYEGWLAITTNHVCYWSEKSFISTIKIIKSQDLIGASSKKNVLSFSKDSKRIYNFTLESESLASEAKSLLNLQRGNTNPVENTKETGGLSKPDDEWNNLVKGAKKRVFQKDEFIIRDGDSSVRLYQVIKGSVRIEKVIKGRDTQVIAILEEGEIFGELSFLEKRDATADVVANEPLTEISIIESYYLQALFNVTPTLATSFYRHISYILNNRLYSTMIHFALSSPPSRNTLSVSKS